jgi:hypothetical protein
MYDTGKITVILPESKIAETGLWSLTLSSMCDLYNFCSMCSPLQRIRSVQAGALEPIC